MWLSVTRFWQHSRWFGSILSSPHVRLTKCYRRGTIFNRGRCFSTVRTTSGRTGLTLHLSWLTSPFRDDMAIERLQLQRNISGEHWVRTILLNWPTDSETKSLKCICVFFSCLTSFFCYVLLSYTWCSCSTSYQSDEWRMACLVHAHPNHTRWVE